LGNSHNPTSWHAVQKTLQQQCYFFHNTAGLTWVSARYRNLLIYYASNLIAPWLIDKEAC
jgi:hypothetical protein